MKEESEFLIQARFVAWVRHNHPEHMIFHIPNGGQRSKIEGARMKSLGVLAGVPDLFIPSLKLFIEMKNTQGTPSAAQWKIMEQLGEYGYAVAVCNSLANAQTVFDNALEVHHTVTSAPTE